MRGTTRWMALVLALVMVAAACGDDDGGSTFGGGGGGIEAFCDLAQEQQELEGAFDEDLNVFDPESVESAFSEIGSLFERAIEIAPDEISGDFEILQENFSTIEQALADADFDFLAVDESLLEDSAEVDAASDRIDDFVEAECGIVANDDDDEGLSDEEIAEQLEESGRGGGLIAQAFVEAGLPEDQANCLAERVTFAELLAIGESADGTPPAEFLEALDECGVSLEQLTELGAMGDDLGDLDLGEESVEDLLDGMTDIEPSIGGGELPPEAIEIFVSTLVGQGFTEEEARCLAGPILEDPTNPDPLAAFEDCGISLSRLAELGG